MAWLNRNFECRLREQFIFKFNSNVKLKSSSVCPSIHINDSISKNWELTKLLKSIANNFTKESFECTLWKQVLFQIQYAIYYLKGLKISLLMVYNTTCNSKDCLKDWGYKSLPKYVTKSLDIPYEGNSIGKYDRNKRGTL